jgi:peptide chain release factor subunit 1
MAHATIISDGVQPQLELLNNVRAGRNRVVTCYLKLEPRDRNGGKYLIKVKNRIKSVSESLDDSDLSRPVREAVRADLARLDDFLQRPGNLPATRGLAVFLCGPLDLFEVVPLPKVYRSRVVIDRHPLIRELAAVEDEFGRLLTVVADRSVARLFEVTAFDVNELSTFKAGNARTKRFSSQSGLLGEHNYNNRIRQEKARHYETISHALFQMKQQHPVRGIVLAGPGKEAAAVEPFLHPYVADRVIGTAKLNPKTATAADVQEATLAVREAHERESERLRVEEMVDSVGNGWAINGLPGTLRRLARGQIRTLLVNAESYMPGFKCNASGRLAADARSCSMEGDAEPVVDLVDEAIEEALRQHVQVDVVYDPEAGKAIEGLAGLLRFR